MNVEPLNNILKIYKNKNKIFEDYFPTETLNKIKNKYYYDKNDSDIFLNDNITFIQKNTGKFYKSGKVIAIDGNEITIKTSYNYITLNMNNYYLFIKYKKNKNKDFYKALYEIL